MSEQSRICQLEGCNNPLPRYGKRWCSQEHGRVYRNAYQLARYYANPEPFREKVRNWNYARRYNISAAQADEMKAKGICDLCGLAALLVIDHDHGTKRIRGVLCHHCNRALGSFKDNPSLLRKAAEYLERT